MTEWAPLAGIVALFTGVGAAIVALLKLRPEAGQITVVAAQGAVVVQQGVIETLNQQLQRQGEQIKSLLAEASRHGDLNLRVSILEEERDKLLVERVELKARIVYLEGELKVIKNGHGS